MTDSQFHINTIISHVSEKFEDCWGISLNLGGGLFLIQTILDSRLELTPAVFLMTGHHNLKILDSRMLDN